MAERRAGAAPPPHGIAAAAVLVAAHSSFMFGYSICVLDTCSGLMAASLRWCGNDWESGCPESEAWQGLVNAALYLGAVLGAVLSGRPRVAAMGGRQQLCLADAFFCAGAVLCGAARSGETLVVGRAVCGVGMGICSVATPLYVAEVSPRERRGQYVTMHQVFISLGILASIALGFPQGPPPAGPLEKPQGLDAWWWRLLLALPVAPALLQAALFLGVCRVDPPAFLVMQGREDEARATLRRIYGLGPRAEEAAPQGPPLKEPLLRPSAEPPPGLPGDPLEAQLAELGDACELAREIPSVNICLAFSDPYLRAPLLLGLFLAAFQQLCGINALMSYSNELFGEAGVPAGRLTATSTAMAVSNVVVSAVSSQVADGWGRRTLLLGGAGVQAVALCALAAMLTPAGAQQALVVPPGFAIVFFTAFVSAFSAGVGAVTWVYISEIYPLAVRGPALCLCGAVNWLSSFAVVFGARFLGLVALCRAFGGCCLLGTVCIYVWVVETRGCDMDDSPLTPKSTRSDSVVLTPPKLQGARGA